MATKRPPRKAAKPMKQFQANGARLRAIRDARGLTREELEGRTGLAAKHILNLELGMHSPRLATLEDILAALGSTPNEFFNDGLPTKWEREAALHSALQAVLDRREPGDRLLIVRLFTHMLPERSAERRQLERTARSSPLSPPGKKGKKEKR